MLLERLDKCLQILSDHEKLIQRDNIALTIGNSSDLIKVARFMSLSGENFDYSESVSHLTERVLSLKNIFCADLVPYKRRLDNMTSDLQRKLDFVLALKESPNLQADVVRKKKLSKEEILKFALSQECYLDHVRNFVGDSDRVYLLVFLSNPGSSANVWTMDALGDSLDMCLDPYCGVKVTVFYFHGKFDLKFPLDYSKSERSDRFR